MNLLVQEFFEDLSSEEEEADELDDEEDMAILMLLDMEHNKRRKHGGSIPGHQTIHRRRKEGHRRLMAEYFDPNPVYPSHLFRRRFRMSPDLFRHIAAAVENHDEYFKQKRNSAGDLGLSPYQKITAALRMITYGVPADFLDDCLAMGESTIIESLRHFAKAIIAIFGHEYLRAPNEQDMARLLAMNKARGFPGMLGSIDCMHWRWKNCPTAWHGQFTGHTHDPTIILEAVADKELWFWHAYFGMPGSCNDINVLHRSPLFARLANGESPPVEFEANGHMHTMGYYLADGIYPAWATFVKTIQNPEGNKRIHFAKAHMAIRKDVEQAFDVLQSHFAIVRGPARFWDQKTLRMIMTACVIMHNMIIEDESGDDVDYEYEGVGRMVKPRKNEDRIKRFVQVHQEIQDREAHEQLRDDLVEELWKFHDERRH